MIARVLGPLSLVLVGGAWGYSRGSLPWTLGGALFGAVVCG